MRQWRILLQPKNFIQKLEKKLTFNLTCSAISQAVEHLGANDVVADNSKRKA